MAVAGMSGRNSKPNCPPLFQTNRDRRLTVPFGVRTRKQFFDSIRGSSAPETDTFAPVAEISSTRQAVEHVPSLAKIRDVKAWRNATRGFARCSFFIVSTTSSVRVSAATTDEAR